MIAIKINFSHSSKILAGPLPAEIVRKKNIINTIFNLYILL